MQGLRGYIQRHRNASIAVGGLIAAALVGCCLIGILADGAEESRQAEERPAAAILTDVTETYAAEEPTDTSGPTHTPEPTETPTPSPTASPRPTEEPTDTPKPTSTPEPTHTPPPAPTSTPERVEAQVVEVVDGDTIKVDVGREVYTVRYIGIDCPETKHPEEPVQWMGPEATQVNQELVGGKTVYLEKDVRETDDYGRLLRYVFLASGTFVNAELVRRGYAQVSTYPPDVRYQDVLLAAQAGAREDELGLWGPTPSSIPPTSTPVPATEVPATSTPAPSGEARVVVDPSCCQFDSPGNDNYTKDEEYVCFANRATEMLT